MTFEDAPRLHREGDRTGHAASPGQASPHTLRLSQALAVERAVWISDLQAGGDGPGYHHPESGEYERFVRVSKATLAGDGQNQAHILPGAGRPVPSAAPAAQLPPAE